MFVPRYYSPLYYYYMLDEQQLVRLYRTMLYNGVNQAFPTGRERRIKQGEEYTFFST